MSEAPISLKINQTNKHRRTVGHHKCVRRKVHYLWFLILNQGETDVHSWIYVAPLAIVEISDEE